MSPMAIHKYADSVSGLRLLPTRQVAKNATRAAVAPWNTPRSSPLSPALLPSVRNPYQTCTEYAMRSARPMRPMSSRASR
jgi:hypothetical protein